MIKSISKGLLLIGLFLGQFQLSAQLSQGGTPLKTPELKSSRLNNIEMPPIQNFIGNDEKKANSVDDKLKPFRFAYPFEVNLSPKNSGEWFTNINGYDVWKLKIKSAGAFSINLIFDDFELPENARLFIYNEEEDYVLGAFTNSNNSDSHKFAVSPVAGDEVTVQFEIPKRDDVGIPFEIIRVNHDYIGILKSGDRRPLGKTAGKCNIDINCDGWNDWEEVKNSVVRLIVHGVEVCSGTLINNTANNQKPYVLSAAHCYDFWNYAATTVYTFNYESPFCAPLDGDPSNSISGAKMKAQSDSLDFALVEMNMIPPPNFRPYYAGWNRSGIIPLSTVSIHHPQGDVKKLAHDAESPITTSFGPGYSNNGFLKITRWNEGVTEAGSSGGALFDANKNLVGTLTGGDAVCNNPVNDYFSRFELAWEYKKDSAKQLKYWLDPLKTEVQVLPGKQFYTGTLLCGAFTNLKDADTYNKVPISNTSPFAGYWGGTNNFGITEIMERFSIKGNEQLSGLSLGVGKFKTKVSSQNSQITIKIYNGNQFPEDLIYSQVIKTTPLAQDAMNYIAFTEVVKPADIFYAGFELTNIQPLDSFAVYQSLRLSTEPNTFYLKKNNEWYNFKEVDPAKRAMANIFELVACNINDFSTDTPKIENPLKIVIYPNPTNSTITFEAGEDITESQISVFDLLGHKVQYRINILNTRRAEIDLRGNVPGVYFIKFTNRTGFAMKKISFIPN